MYYVYILECNYGKLYTGYSANLKKRIAQHKNGEVFSTKSKLPIELIFYEAFLSQADAKRREMYFKTTSGKRALKIMLQEYFKKKNPGLRLVAKRLARVYVLAHERELRELGKMH